ncbi:MAG TPA: hypothetical protein VFF60_12510 [Candidatus Binatus sp.]|nr:hypothetical protein [Candidatus Binatus sp.]
MIRRSLVSCVVLCMMFVIAGCAGSGSYPNAVTVPQQSTATTSPQHVNATAQVVANGCTLTPIKNLQVSATDLGTLTSAGANASFTACTQSFSNYTVTVAPAGIVSLSPSSPVTPTEPPNGTAYSATITVTALANGTATITITDKKGNVKTVTVTVAVPTGIITFNPASPENFAAGFQNGIIAISEGGYSGGFSITACSGTGGTPGGCSLVPAPQDHFNGGIVDCSNGSSGNQNRLSAEIQTSAPTTLLLNSDPVGTAAAISCTVTVSDSFGHHADYTFTAPNTVPSGQIVISPSSVNFGPGQQPFSASVSESGYFGGFSIQSCNPVSLSGSCAVSGGVGVATCTGGSAPNLNVMNAVLTVAMNTTTLNVQSLPQGTGLPTVTCVLQVQDTLGNLSSPFTFTAPAQ